MKEMTVLIVGLMVMLVACGGGSGSSAVDGGSVSFTDIVDDATGIEPITTFTATWPTGNPAVVASVTDTSYFMVQSDAAAQTIRAAYDATTCDDLRCDGEAWRND